MRPGSLLIAVPFFIFTCYASGQAPAHHHGGPSIQSTTLQVAAEGSTVTFTPADLAKMPQTTVKVHNKQSQRDESYSGVSVSTLLAKAGFTVGPTTHQKMLHSYLVAQGTDQYWVLYSVTEVEASEHMGDVIVALTVDGHPLTGDGDFKLVSSEDTKPQRWVRNLSSLRLVVVTETD
jgi:hypothetical protein